MFGSKSGTQPTDRHSDDPNALSHAVNDVTNGPNQQGGHQGQQPNMSGQNNYGSGGQHGQPNTAATFNQQTNANPIPQNPQQGLNQQQSKNTGQQQGAPSHSGQASGPQTHQQGQSQGAQQQQGQQSNQPNNMQSQNQTVDDSSRNKTVRWQEGQKPDANQVTMSPVPSNPDDRNVNRPNPIVVSSTSSGQDVEAQNSKHREGFDILRFLCIIVLLLVAIFLIFLMVEATGII